MPWTLMIQAIQALLSVGVQYVGQRDASLDDHVSPEQVGALLPTDRAALAHLAQLCTPPTPSAAAPSETP